MSEYDLWITMYDNISRYNTKKIKSKNIIENKLIDKMRIKEARHNTCRNNIIDLCVQHIRLILLSINIVKFQMSMDIKKN